MLDTGSRTWDALNQWYVFDVAGHYSPLGIAWAVAGVRFDSFATNFQNPANQVALAGLPTDEADVQFSTWIPYLGLKNNIRADQRFIKGWIDWFSGRIRYNEIRANLWRWRGPRTRSAKRRFRQRQPGFLFGGVRRGYIAVCPRFDPWVFCGTTSCTLAVTLQGFSIQWALFPPRMMSFRLIFTGRRGFSAPALLWLLQVLSDKY